MIDDIGKINRLTERQLDMLGNVGEGRAFTATLRVSPDGSGADGLSWRTAYTTIQDALDAASTDEDDCTLILVSPHATNYDINTTGDPTWAANVEIRGTHRNWAKVMNEHGTATSIMKLTGKAAVVNLNFNLGTGTNGLILTHSGGRVYSCQFVGEDLTGAATALWLDHASGGKHFKVTDCDFLGNDSTHMTAFKVDEFGYSRFERLRMHRCLKGVHIIGDNSDNNIFQNVDIGECAIALDLDAGSEQHCKDVLFHSNTVNVDDEVHDHIWGNIFGQFPITIYPDDLTGITLTADAVANVWGADTEIRAAATATRPFRVVGYLLDPQIAQWYQLRLSADSGSTWFDQVGTSTSRTAGVFAPAGTEAIFNVGTRISGSIKAASAGSDTMQVWLKIQEI